MAETNCTPEQQNKDWSDEEIDEWFDSEDDTEKSEIFAKTKPEDIEDKYAASQLRIVRQTMDFSLHHLRQSLQEGTYINISPSYQRRARWDQKKKSQLIESFLMNIPIPPIYLFECEYNSYEVMDGRQRLGTINEYLTDMFQLKGLEFWKEIEGKRYSELPDVLQRGLLRRTLSAIVLLAETSQPSDTDFDVRMVLFKRLNTGGESLNLQELRNALYPGHFNGMLHRISRSDLFTKIWRIPPKEADEPQNVSNQLLKNSLYKKMADCELVLRFFAIRDTITENRSGSLMKLLNLTMTTNYRITEQETIGLEKSYMDCLVTINNIFDGEPFILPKTNKPSRPLYDALMVAYSLNKDIKPLEEKPEINARLESYIADSTSYDVLVGRANTVAAIRDRIKLAEKILFRNEEQP